MSIFAFSGRLIAFTFFVSIGLVQTAYAIDETKAPAIVKKSSSGICHDEHSGSYTRTKRFTAYPSVQACLDDSGKLPKSSAKRIVKQAANDALNEGRKFSYLYNRKDWPHWIDQDKDCQNTRHELLIETSTEAVAYKTQNECQVLKGAWYDPYSNDTYFESTDLDLDHIVPLKFAHGRGGSFWSRATRQEFANDTDNLILVKASLNRQKGAKGLDEWLPPNHAYRCEYIGAFMKVVSKYSLTLVPSELRTVSKMQNACSKSNYASLLEQGSTG